MEKYASQLDNSLSTDKIKKPKWVLLKKRIIGRRNDPLMTRWEILTTPLFSIKFHRFHRSDPSCLHDHPWPFISIILSGGYYEVTEKGKKWYDPFSILFRGAEYKHRVELKNIYKGYPYYFHSFIEPLTLVITGPRQREWGFFTKKLGWIPWHKFKDSNDDC